MRLKKIDLTTELKKVEKEMAHSQLMLDCLYIPGHPSKERDDWGTKHWEEFHRWQKLLSLHIEVDKLRCAHRRLKEMGYDPKQFLVDE
jgi:hypothetical protein